MDNMPDVWHCPAGYHIHFNLIFMKFYQCAGQGKTTVSGAERRDGMLNYIWVGMIAVSFLCSAVTGRMEELCAAVSEGADKAVRLVLSMAGVMCLWSGMMKAAENSGLTRLLSKMLSPILCALMPDYPKDSRAMQAVCANVTANILGLGNAATPLGILAMKEMQKTNTLKTAPNNSMIAFVVMNTASVQLIPATVAALRKACGSASPYGILTYTWAASLTALAAGLLLVKLFSRSKKEGRLRMNSVLTPFRPSF